MLKQLLLLKPKGHAVSHIQLVKSTYCRNQLVLLSSSSVVKKKAISKKTSEITEAMKPAEDVIAATEQVNTGAVQVAEEGTSPSPSVPAKVASGKKQKSESSSAAAASADKGSKIQVVQTSLKKRYQENVLFLFNESSASKLDVISTGSLVVDDAVGVGGLPLGRIVEIYGPEASGKTSLALSTIAQAQKLGGKCAYIDAEHALDGRYASTLGVKLDELYFAKPDSGEQALEIVNELVHSNSVKVIVVDSVAALLPQSENLADMGTPHMGQQARLMSQALRKLTPAISKSNTLVIFLNQLRMKLNVMFGNPEITSGGHALKFYSSIRIDVRKEGKGIMDGDVIVGTRHKINVKKNKVGQPGRTGAYNMYFGKGIDNSSEILDLGVERKVIDKNGSFFYFKANQSEEGNGILLGQGKEKALAYLNEHEELRQVLRKKILDTSSSVKPKEADVVLEDDVKPVPTTPTTEGISIFPDPVTPPSKQLFP